MLVLFGVCVYGVGLLFSAIKGAPYVPTSRNKLKAIIDVLSLSKKDVLFELGSGDGRFTRLAAKLSGVRGIGIEVNPLLIWWSRFLTKKEGLSNVTFLKQNIFSSDLSSATVLYLFLMPELIVKLLPKFKKELKKGTIIVSHGFKIIPWENKLYKTIKEPTFSTFFYRV